MKVTVGAVVRGRTSLKYKTGAWRDSRPVVDEAACRHCGVCVDVCPDGSVSAKARPGGKKPVYVIDYDYCKGCGLCANECPTEAIKMIPEVK